MSLGINCLTTDDEGHALELARELDGMNHQRRAIESTMRDEELAAIETSQPVIGASVCVYHPDWHQGVVGLVESRLKETYWSTTLAFARSGEKELRGSGRSIPDRIRSDVLELADQGQPGE